MDINKPVLNNSIIYDLTKEKKGIKLYSFLSPMAVIVLAIVIGYLCHYMITDPNLLSKIAGCFLAIIFTGYIGYYLVRFFQSRKHSTLKIVLDDKNLEVTSLFEVKRISIDEIIFSMSYSSSTNLCIIVATENDYITMNCSCSYLFSKNGAPILNPFYAINEFFMKLNPNHINYIKSNKSKRKNPFVVPHFLFEVEFYTNRVKKFIDTICPKYRFQ